MSFKRENGAARLPIGIEVSPATERFIKDEAERIGVSRGKALDLAIQELQILRELNERLARPRAHLNSSKTQCSLRF